MPLLDLCLTLLAQSDPARALRSKDARERLAAVEELAARGAGPADELLAGALADRDFEVVERAAAALGAHAAARAVPALADLATEAPLQRLRATAAEALRAIDPQRASAELAKRVNGKRADAALEALGALAGAELDPRAHDAVTKAWRKAEKAKDEHAAVVAAGALAASDPRTRGESLEAALRSPRLAVRAAALEAVARAPSPGDARALLGVFAEPALDPVLERRVIRALVALAPELPASAADGAAPDWERAFDAVGEGDRRVAVRAVRLASALAQEAAAAEPARADARETIDRALSHGSASVRAAACRAAGEAGDDELAQRVRALVESDPEARVRHVALRVAVARFGTGDAETVAAAIARLAGDADPWVREEAAVALGVDSLRRAVEPLADALADREWTVAACAAVSLGKTREDAALEPLSRLAESPDWRLRGAAIAGLTHWARAPCAERMIRALGDADGAIAKLAHEFLQRATGETLPADEATWRKWWEENASKVHFRPTAEVRERLEKYGYGSPDYTTAYDALDVIVFAGRPGGDNIQRLLQRLGIAHRLTEANRLVGDAVHPDAVYVANCPGEIEPKDVERLQWFVRTGGYLFASCWALHETVERVYPGVVQKYETKGEVLDDVPASCAAPASPYVQGVFPPHTTPIFKLEGAHLIEVLDPERCEVLIDSPICAERWGSGELAVWFRAGHGLILDSVNHFDLQGFEAALGLRTPEDRVAYAFDHLGLDYPRWRAIAGEKLWSSNVAAAKEIPDLFAFRFLTNFVRRKRIGE